MIHEQNKFDLKIYIRLRDIHLSMHQRAHVESERKEALENVKSYLDSCGKKYRMRKPLFKYSVEDQRTWKYLDVSQAHKKHESVPQIFNPNFAYSHLI